MKGNGTGMKYYHMYQDKCIVNCVKLRDFPTDESVNFTKEDADKLRESTIIYATDDKNVSYPSLIEAPITMVDQVVQKVIMMYDETIIFKSVAIINKEENTQRRYKVMLLDRVDCLHELTEYKKDKSLLKIVLDSKKVSSLKIFQIEGTKRRDIIVSMDIVESLLRRQVYGIQFDEIDVI